MNCGQEFGLLRWGILQTYPQFTSLTLAPVPAYEPLPQPHRMKSSQAEPGLSGPIVCLEICAFFSAIWLTLFALKFNSKHPLCKAYNMSSIQVSVGSQTWLKKKSCHFNQNFYISHAISDTQLKK